LIYKKIFSSETDWPNESKLGKKHPWKVLYKECSFSSDQKQELPMAAMFVNGSELNEQSLYRTFQECFLPSFDSFGKAVSEETIF
jgi:hypothetical protein